MSQLMEVKAKASYTAEGGKKKASFSFMRELKEELKKISWTTKQELVLCTKVVVWSTFIFGLGIYIADLMIKSALELIKLVIHFIFG